MKGKKEFIDANKNKLYEEYPNLIRKIKIEKVKKFLEEK